MSWEASADSTWTSRPGARTETRVAHWSVSRAAIAAGTGLLGGSLAGSILVGLLAIGGLDPDASALSALLGVAVASATALAGAFWGAELEGHSQLGRLGLRRAEPTTVLSAAGAGLLLALAFGTAYTLIVGDVPARPVNLADTSNVVVVGLAFIVVAGLAPIAYELMIRGLVFDAARSHIGLGVAIGVAVAVGGLFYELLGEVGALPVLVLQAVLTLQYWQTRSIASGGMTHAGCNAALMAAGLGWSAVPLLLITLVMGASTGAGVSFLANRQPPAEEEPEQ